MTTDVGPVFRVAVIPGDGVGREVIPVGMRVLEAVMPDIRFDVLPWGCEYHDEHGEMMPGDGLQVLQRYDAIYLGAVGWPTVHDTTSLWGLLLPIRKAFEQYVNVRPVRLLHGIASPLRDRGIADIDMLFLRENTEGEYSGTGGRVHVGTESEVAVEVPVFTRRAISRVARYAFNEALKRRHHLISVTKSNASRYAYVLWDEVIREVSVDFPDITVERVHVDAMAARMVLRPGSVDVVVASNLFADILTDLGGALQGGLGLAASANLDPTRRYPSMFEPVHGSAPDIAGQGKANPIGAVWSGALLLRHLGFEAAADQIEAAIQRVVEAGTLTPDVGGCASTEEVGDALLSALPSRNE